jgi:hypothetical protein
MSDPDHGFFEALAALEPVAEPKAPSRLQSRIYTELMRLQASGGPILTILQTPRLCVFEEGMRLAPVPERLRQMNYCMICHARVLAEHFEDAPIFWTNCPYVRFQDR